MIANYVELWIFMEDVSHNDKSDVGAKAAGFANQLSKFLIYFNLQSLHKIYAFVTTNNQALKNSKLHFQNTIKYISNLKELFQI